MGFPTCTRLVRGIVLSVRGREFVEAARAPGGMLATGRQFLILSPQVVLLPGLAIFVIVLAINLVGDALRDLLGPRTYSR